MKKILHKQKSLLVGFLGEPALGDPACVEKRVVESQKLQLGGFKTNRMVLLSNSIVLRGGGIRFLKFF